MTCPTPTGTEITVRATPRAARNRVVAEEGQPLRVYVTAPPDKGRANIAVQTLLARHLGIAKSGLRLVRGASARTKVFRLTAA